MTRTACRDCPPALRETGMTQEDYAQTTARDVSSPHYHDFVKHVDVGSWKDPVLYSQVKPPLMSEVMDIVPAGCFALCEVKGGDRSTAAALAELVTKHAWGPEQLVFIGFDLEVMTELKQHLVR